jgi:ABC-type transporter Mla MlaB component
MEAGTTVVVDCARLDRPDAGTVDALARLTLAARQDRIRLRFENVPPSLCGLMALCGLSRLLLGLEAGRQAEEGEEARGVEEEGDVRDPPL